MLVNLACDWGRPSRNWPCAWTPSDYYRFLLSVSRNSFLSTDLQSAFWKRFGKEPSLGFPMDLTNLQALLNDQKASSHSEWTSHQLAFRLLHTRAPHRTLNHHVECGRAPLAEGHRRPGGTRFQGRQYARRGPRGKIRLRRRIPQGNRRPLSDDHRSHHHVERPIHTLVGRWLSKVSSHRRRAEVPRVSHASAESSQIQRRAPHRAGRPHVLQRGARFREPSQRL